MKKMFLLLALSTLLLIGCSSSQNGEVKKTAPIATITPSPSPEPSPTPEPVPEPYIKAIENINNGSIDMAMTYIDLTISDFSDTKFVLKSHILKSYILAAKSWNNSVVMKIYMQGSEQYRASSLVEVKSLERIVEALELLQKNNDELTQQLLVSAEYVLEHYNSVRTMKMHDSSINYPEVVEVHTDLSSFSRTGFPVPTESKLEELISYYYGVALMTISKDIFDGENVDFVELFTYIGNFLYPQESARPFMEEIIRLTEDDQYNESRIQILKKMEKIDSTNNE